MKKRSGNQVCEISHCRVANDEINNWLAQNPDMSSGRSCVLANNGQVVDERGKKEIAIKVLDKTFWLNASCFFQSNGYLINDLVKKVVGNKKGHLAWDLFCGVGLFTAFLSESFEKVKGIEQNHVSVEFAKKNLHTSRNTELIRDDVYEWVLKISQEITNSAMEKPDYVIMDPPREGVSKKLIQLIAGWKIPHLCYVACDPVSLARDSMLFTKLGYRMHSLQGFDFYPQTSHLELVAEFSFQSN